MDDESQRAWAYLSRVAEPPNPRLADLVASLGAVEAADRVRRRALDDPLLVRATEARRDTDCAEKDLHTLARMGGRLVTAQDEEWPQLAFASFRGVDGKQRRPAHPPLVLWAVGPARLSA
ncbi:MAG: DNA processing protein DprA, partial [Actinomycetia bacterium]|nr:DNA processing protein DprA [Actinomycetes bacterium]